MSSFQATKVRQALRVLTKNPGLTVVAVLLLALGIGASTAIFSILWAVAIRPLPYEHPEQLVLHWRTDPVVPLMPSSGPDFLDWAKQSDIFAALAAATAYHPTLTGASGMEHLDGFQVTPDILKVLKAQPAAGRLFAAGDDQPGRDHVVVLGKVFGARGTGRGLATIGRTLTLNGEEYEVIGRLPDMLTITITLAESKYPTFEARNGFCGGLLERVNALPGVKSSALEGESVGHLAAADSPLTPLAFRQVPFAQLLMVSPDYSLFRSHPW